MRSCFRRTVCVLNLYTLHKRICLPSVRVRGCILYDIIICFRRCNILDYEVSMQVVLRGRPGASLDNLQCRTCTESIFRYIHGSPFSKWRLAHTQLNDLHLIPIRWPDSWQRMIYPSQPPAVSISIASWAPASSTGGNELESKDVFETCLPLVTWMHASRAVLYWSRMAFWTQDLLDTLRIEHECGLLRCWRRGVFLIPGM